MAEGKHAPWRLWILIVLWVLQLLLLGYSLVVYIIALVAIGSWNDYTDTHLTSPSIAGVVANMVVLVVSFILTIAEIVQVGRRKLTPRFYLISNVLKAVVWTGLTVASIVITHQALDNDGYATGVTVVVAVILLLFFVLPMIYGIVVMVKTRKARRTGGYKGVDPLLQHTSYSAQAPGNVELESQLPGGVYNHQKDTRFEAYRQSAVPSQPVYAQQGYGGQQGYGAQAYDGTPQYHQQQQTGYVS